MDRPRLNQVILFSCTMHLNVNMGQMGMVKKDPGLRDPKTRNLEPAPRSTKVGLGHPTYLKMKD